MPLYDDLTGAGRRAPPASPAEPMAAADAIDAKHGRGTIVPAANVERGRDTRAARPSPRYTTNIKDLAVARA